MSWGMSLVGSKKAVIAAVKKETAYGNQSQLDPVKEFLVKELEAFPEVSGAGTSGIEVIASGHHDENYRSLSIALRSVALKLDEPESSSPAPPSSAEASTGSEGASSSSSS